MEPKAAARRDKKNVLILACCQALNLTASSVQATILAVVGHQLAGNKALATAPWGAVMLGGAAGTIPASMLMARIGRRNSFTVGTLAGVLGLALSTGAIYAESFALLCLGSFLFGLYNASSQFYRFAAADVAREDFKTRAVSLVLAGGVISAVLGPELARRSKDLFPGHAFLGPYASLVVVTLLAIALLRLLDIPVPARTAQAEGARPIGRIMRQPVFIVAALGGMTGYGIMILIMVATPLAMRHTHSFSDTVFVIEWHLLAMFLPSFVTGNLINRFGPTAIMLAGASLELGSTAVALSGTGRLHFWLALVLVGVGWNFLYIGSTALVTKAYTAAERARTQAANDLLVSLSIATASFVSGTLMHDFGWRVLNSVAIPFLVLSGGATLWLARSHRATAPAAKLAP